MGTYYYYYYYFIPTDICRSQFTGNYGGMGNNKMASQATEMIRQ